MRFFCVGSGLIMDHSMSSSPVSEGLVVYLHPRLTLSPSALWMASGPVAVTCRPRPSETSQAGLNSIQKVSMLRTCELLEFVLGQMSAGGVNCGTLSCPKFTCQVWIHLKWMDQVHLKETWSVLEKLRTQGPVSHYWQHFQPSIRPCL